MAVFTDLHDVAQVLSEHIREEIGIADVQAGAPREATATTEATARLTLLYATPQAAHRSDPAERGPDGARRPPPLSLSCTYLITTTGADAEDPVAGHFALGRIMTLYHDRPLLTLPLSDQPGAPPGAFSEIGEGDLAVVQVPVTLEQIDKIWTAVDVQVQPWTLLEVSPVQLRSLLEDVPPAPVVRPGGIGLDVRAAARPVVARVSPAPVRPRGRVRIDATPAGALESVLAGGVSVAAADGSLDVTAGGTAILLRLDDGGLETLATGAHPLTVRAGGMVSRRATLRIGDPAAPAVDAPAPGHSAGDDLALTGANLADAQEVVLWPDAGLSAPSDVVSIAPDDVTATSLTVPSSGAPGLEDLPAGRGPWRLTVRVGERLYTPFVLLEPAG